MRLFGFVIAAVVIALFPVTVYTQGEPATAAKPMAEWTFMFYMDSDNDLEQPQMEDLEEMMGVGTTGTVNIVAFVDRHPSGDEDNNYTNRDVGGLKNWTTTKLVVVEKGRLHELADPGEANMGDPDNLVEFIEQTAKNFPAKRYALIFGDHGSGWPQILGDETNDDHLDMTELGGALARVTKSLGGKLELIGFDACLMANFEVARTVAPYAKALVGSQELEPGNGWDYKPLFTRINANPAADGFQVGRMVVDTFRDYYNGESQGYRDVSITLSVMDLSKIDAMNTAINNLAVQNQAFIKAGGRPNILKTASARAKAEDYGSRGEGKHVAEFFDIVHYAENIKLTSGDAGIAKAADAVIAATKAAVVYKANGAAHPHSNGLSIYFPNKADTITQSGYAKQPFTSTLKWTGLLMDYTGIIVQDTQKPQIAQAQTSSPDISKDETITVTSNVKGDDIDEATFVLAELAGDDTIIIGAIPTEPDEKGKLSETWDGTWFAISDGKKESICPITDFYEIDDAKDVYYAEVPAQVRYRGRKEWVDITMYFVIDFNGENATGDFVYAFLEKNGQQREVEIEAGDSIRPVYLKVDPNGEMEEIAATDEADILNVTASDGLAIGMMGVADGDYLLGFAVTDLAGNDSDTFVGVTVK